MKIHILGGIAGRLRSYGLISYSYNLGNISNKGLYTGGICGYNHANGGTQNNEPSRASTIVHCYNRSNTISGVSRTGGIAGANFQYCYLKECYISNDTQVKYNTTIATNNIGSSSQYLGNIVGYAYTNNNTYINNIGKLSNMPTVYEVVNGSEQTGLNNGESNYWSNTAWTNENFKTPKLKWEK